MNANKPVSKLLLLESDAARAEAIAQTCAALNCVCVPVRRDALSAALKMHYDLGGVLLGEDFGGSIDAAAAVAVALEAERPELPIVLRRASHEHSDALPEPLRRVPCGVWFGSDPQTLVTVLEEQVFSHDYPDPLVDGITDMTFGRLRGLFPGLDVNWDVPGIVRDRIIFGEVLTLIPIETAWCRGWLLMQTEEAPLIELLPPRAGRDEASDFRDVNGVLAELTNLVWGAFRNRYLGNALAAGEAGWGRAPVQVPLLINHRRRYLSFGSDNPQLCIKYRLTCPDTGREVVIDQRFVFSLGWSREGFDETAAQAAAAAEEEQASGELELF
ncbi:chemotaxis protein CheX [Paraburkholderia lycopersici]|uniref:Chemotaxis phosphatase CheX n=1 Tax=Paraburkholderia lycopersici TaxID=416944 RepID=A0A1G7B9H9_9BURK|nr:chemotaxis protein CheX [Paraburkholderia lycopersici]SDE23663.1 Chemotaxis phosphatase CheX [Paraburkholderia lycopersici]